jgi:DNA-binding LacI/PurR family transcriptional regulator
MGIDFNNPVPLYEQIENDIKAKILNGKLKVGDQVGSHQELSKEYNVSLITVKKALSDLISKGILFSRIGKGTYVAKKSGSLIRGHNTIGLVLRDLKQPFFSLIVQAVEEKAYSLGYNVLLSSSSGRIEKEDAQISHFQNIGVDGLIIASITLKYTATRKIRELHESNFPYIMVSYMHDQDIWHVGTNNEKGQYIATEHLIKLGYKKIGYVNAEEGNLLAMVRRQGFEKCFRDYVRKPDESLFFQLEKEKDRFKSGYEIGLKFNKLKNRPDALVFYNDLAALGFLEGAAEMGVKIPDDVAVVGFDDIERAKYGIPSLTTVHQPIDLIGEKAVEIISRRIEGKDNPVRTILEPRLVVRSSCGAKAISKVKTSRIKETT